MTRQDLQSEDGLKGNQLPRETEEAKSFEELLDYLWQNHEFDFSGYKRPSLMRRTQLRMSAVQVESYSAYLNYLKKHPKEFIDLFKSIEINVTDFFRDAFVWDYVKTVVIPRMISSKPPNGLIKVWSAGCASGEEAYTVAILLAEALGIEEFKQRVRIYATDVDQEAVVQARRGRYSESQVLGVPANFLAKYFERTDDSYVFRQDLRRSIVFVQRNLILNSPFSQIDLLLCRNTLFYLNIEGQIRALVRFHFGLENGGLLVLGQSELPTLCIENVLFTPVSLQHRVFAKVLKPNLVKLLPRAFRKRRCQG
ncbi:MAG: protein-glutamate O-methyltransferase CheR [Trichocoleus desertorum ATA4-8-CV12]|jgi:two-component system CheB/CheR fusion protein|nr:protein-glutamate O-methyltransferase CheR [Trichocoleus desertorum ATA4-8-CV12]